MFSRVRFSGWAGLLAAAGMAVLALAPRSASAQSVSQPVIPWTWSAQPNHYPLVDVIARQRHGRFALHEELTKTPGASIATLAHYLEKAAIRTPVWQVTLAEPGAGDLTGAALVVAGTQVFVARYDRIATGCMLYAFAAADGKLQWQVVLQGVGPISHSKWYNRVQLNVLNGNPVVFGNEGPSLGYIEQRDAGTGALLTHQSLKDVQTPQPLAEPLYVELQNMLRRQPSYQVSARDFVQRHAMNPAVLAELGTAVQQVDGLPVQYGRYVIAAALRTLPTGEQVVEAKRR